MSIFVIIEVIRFENPVQPRRLQVCVHSVLQMTLSVRVMLLDSVGRNWKGPFQASHQLINFQFYVELLIVRSRVCSLKYGWISIKTTFFFHLRWIDNILSCGTELAIDLLHKVLELLVFLLPDNHLCSRRGLPPRLA